MGISLIISSVRDPKNERNDRSSCYLFQAEHALYTPGQYRLCTRHLDML